MTETLRPMAEAYSAALRSYVSSGGEPALKRGYELGRQALAEGLGVLELAMLHHEALSAISSADPFASDGRLLESARDFFVECLSPFEIVHRGYSETNTALRGINEALEREARRFAHALHDDVGPLLVAVHLVLEALARDVPDEKASRIVEAREYLQRIEDDLRRISHELRPLVLEDLGLVPALLFLAEGIATRSGVRITVDGDDVGRLPVAVETALYRAVQEALINVGKHAGATRGSVRLSRETRMIRCVVADDGVGFDLSPGARRTGQGGLGLTGIRERVESLGGTFEITAVPGSGTELHMTIPLEA